MMPLHTVAPGECLESIAHARGVAVKDIWDHPDNHEVKARRRNPNVLLSGDRLVVPLRTVKTVAAQTNKRHHFVLDMPRVRLSVRLLVEDEVLADEAYELHLDGREPVEGTTDAHGLVNQLIPADTVTATLVLSRLNRHLELQIGHLDPVDTASGAAARLRQLGFLRADASSTWALTDAWLSFQQHFGLTMTGQLDSETSDALETNFGT